MKSPFTSWKKHRSQSDVIDDVEYALQDAWLNRHGVTRAVRFVLIIFIAFIATTAFVQSNERKRCNESKVFLRSYAGFLDKAAQARRDDATHADTLAEKRDDIDTAQAYEQLLKLIKPGIDRSCNEVYPILPYIGI